MKLILEDVKFKGTILNQVIEPEVNLTHLSYEFEFGKVYHIASERQWDGWAFNLLIAGAIVEQAGIIKLNDTIVSPYQRGKMSWRVHRDEIMRFGLFIQSVKNQIRAGIKKGNRYPLSEQDYIQNFKLTPQRYDRYLRQQSSEGWRSSCAIGLAHDKQIFCFPPFEHGRKNVVSTSFVEDHGERWFFDMLKFMKSLNCLILLPLPIDMDTSEFCDGVIKV